MNVSTGRLIYITITDFYQVDVNLSKYRKARKVTNDGQEIVYIKDKHFLYLSGANFTKSVRSIMQYTES